MKRLVAPLHRTFSALGIPNFRRFFYGQSTSLIGTWMQSVAQSWLVYTLTHSATALGAVIAIQTLPVLLLGPYAGVIADRTDKRRLMVVLQSLMGVQALVLGILAVTHVVNICPGNRSCWKWSAQKTSAMPSASIRPWSMPPGPLAPPWPG
jgi:MFS family permease